MVKNLDEEKTKKILKGITIPPQPQILVDLQMESAFETVSLDKITSIIVKDIGISGAVLKIINSPCFGMRGKVSSIRQALSLLGLKNVLNIIRCLTLRNAFDFEHLAKMTQIWDNSSDVAMACMAISKMLGVGSVDESYTLGLFHDSGITLMMDKFENYPEVIKRAYAEPKRRITDVENAEFQTNHSVVGYFTAKAWNLPKHICQAIADHHKTEPIFREEVSYDPQGKILLAVLKLAENTCTSHKSIGDAGDHFEFKRIKKDLLIYLGIGEYDLEDIQATVREMLVV